MILIADSGATKTDWCFIDKYKNIKKFQTLGLNPSYVSKDIIDKEFLNLSAKIRELQPIDNIFFFGAGCSTPEFCKIIFDPLSKIFSKSQIQIDTDLLGACKAICGDTEGLVGILGTGSNSCIYKDGKITENIPSVGYLLGDEGSGTFIGKTLLKTYMTGFMPDDMCKLFAQRYPLSRNELLDRLYHQASPNKFLASIMPFAVENRNNDFVKEVVRFCFEQFFVNQILKYQNYECYNLYFVGSVAKLFEKELSFCANKHNMSIKNILQSPIDGLVNYYIKKLKF